MNVISSVIFWEFSISFLESLFFLDFCYFCLWAARILLHSNPFPTGLGFLSVVFMLCSLPPDKEVMLPWTAHNSLLYNAAHNSITDVGSEDSEGCGHRGGPAHQHAPLCPVGGMLSPAENHCHTGILQWIGAQDGTWHHGIEPRNLKYTKQVPCHWVASRPAYLTCFFTINFSPLLSTQR